MLSKTGGANVSAGYSKGNPYPTKNGYETFNVIPVKIVNGIVSNKKKA